MRSKAHVVAIATMVLVSLSGGVAAGDPEVYPLSQVRKGQKGFGLTTFQGTEPEKFQFEVMGVMKNFLPKLDIILVKSDDKKLSVSGFWRGMSGSPLYLDGKVVCAFSYGFQFNKVAIGGCTPIAAMKREGFRKPRRARRKIVGKKRRRLAKVRDSGLYRTTPSAAASFQEWLQAVPNGLICRAMRREAGVGEGSWVLQGPRPSVGIPTEHSGGLTPAAIPLSLSGFSAPAFKAVKDLMTGYPLAPMVGGGTGSSKEGPSKFTMGGSISVQLIRGDMSAAGTGTVSYIGEKGVLAFGHPMFQAGELYAPVTSAEVHGVIPSAANAFVLASPMKELGSLVQDRQSTIMADTSLRTGMIPVDIEVTVGKKRGDGGSFSVEILNSRFFTASLASVAAMNATNYFLPDQDRVTARIDSTVSIRGHGTLSFIDYLHSSAGALGVVSGARGLRALVPLLNNPFEPVEIEHVKLNIQANYDSNYGDISAIRLPTRELEPGTRSHVSVELTAFDGGKTVKKIPFDVPKELAGDLIRVDVSAGDAADLVIAPPQSLGDLVRALKKLLPGNVYAVTLYSANEGLAVDGKLVHDLPASALDKLKTSTESKSSGFIYQPVHRSLFKADRVINGRMSILVKVAKK